MTIPTTGPITWNTIKAEYSFGSPFALSALRGKTGVPASGAITLSGLRGLSGTSGTPTFDLAPGTYSYSGDDFTSVDIVCSVPVTWTYTRTGTTRSSSTPVSGAASDTFHAQVTAPFKGSASGSWTLEAKQGAASLGIWYLTLTAYGTGGFEGTL